MSRQGKTSAKPVLEIGVNYLLKTHTFSGLYLYLMRSLLGSFKGSLLLISHFKYANTMHSRDF